MGVGTVYRHFPDRDNLLDAVVAESIERVAGYAREALEEENAWAAFSGFLLRCAELSAEDRALSETLAADSLEQRWASLAEEAGLSRAIATLVDRGRQDVDLDAQRDRAIDRYGRLHQHHVGEQRLLQQQRNQGQPGREVPQPGAAPQVCP